MRLPLTKRLGICVPIIQAPMIGPKSALAVAVSSAGGLGSIACAPLSPEQVAREVACFRAIAPRPFNLNFFCHSPEPVNPGREQGWRHLLRPYAIELGLDPNAEIAPTNRAAFDEIMCDTVLALAPPVVSFHFGLPEARLVKTLRAAGIFILSTATTVAEARWLADHGADAIIAQGLEAGGHRGMFLTDDLMTQSGLIALLPQIVDAVALPVIAAGGIADARGVAAAFTLGAEAVQIGTAYFRTPEAGLNSVHLAALETSAADATAITTLLTGRPARGLVNRLMRDLGPLHPAAPAFPRASFALQPLRQAAEARGLGDFSPLWAGPGFGLASAQPAAVVTQKLAAGART